MIRFEDASFHYGGENGTGDGVDHIDLTIADGEVVVLCGESGCGKTTVTRMISGLAPHFFEGQMKGSVHIDELCVNAAELPQVARRVGSVFQNPKSQFFNVDSTGELVFGCENLGLPRDEIRRRFDATVGELQLEPLLGRNIFELSGGEKQQIACGSAHAQGPDVYVMDEPSSNLDKKAMLRLRKILLAVKAQGKTIVLSEHRLHYLMDLADRFVYMRDGRIEREFSRDQMAALSNEELGRLGLRCTSLSSLEDDFHARRLPPSTNRAIEVLDLTCTRGNSRILDIDRAVLPEHGVVALIGDNGCGKSTLAESLCGLIPSDGAVSFGGHYLTARERTRQSFMVMQDVNRQLFSESVLEEVTLNASCTRERASEVLGRLGLEAYADRHPASLSGGQKQRVAIACALCAGNDVIFYDEPTSGLDRRGMESFGFLVEETRDDVSCSVIITHDPELILQCCTHVLYLKNGRAQSFYPLDAEGARRMLGYFRTSSDVTGSRPRRDLGVLERILGYAGRSRPLVFAAAALMLAGAAASLVPYVFVYRLLSHLIGGGAITLRAALPAVAAVAAGSVAHAVLYTLGLLLSHKAAFDVLENLRRTLQGKMDLQPLGDVLGMGKGNIKKLLSDDIESIELLLAHLVPEGLANVLVVAATLVAVMVVDWQLFLCVVAVVTLGVLASRQMYAVGMDRMGSYFAATKRLNNTIVEFVRGMEVVRVFNRQEDSGRRFEESVRGYRDFALDWFRVCWPWMSVYGSAFSSVMLYVLPVGVLLVLVGQLTLGRLALVVCLSLGIAPLLLRCVSFVSTLMPVNMKIQALEKAVDQAPLEVGAHDFAGTGLDVRFDDVRFSYRDSEVLRGVSLVACQGQTTALVGVSGSGKTTLARLLAHQYDVQSGSVSVGGQDVRDMTGRALNDLVSYVSQDLFLFNRSLAENIRVGRPDATDEEVRAAAHAACCDDFLGEFEQGLDTLAGDAGARLSGGQRQRIAFARAILKDAPIVVLDEATAFVDAENERRMEEAMGNLLAKKTVIVIAHKLRSVMGADKIVMLEGGRVVAEGTHDELSSTCEEYRALWSLSARTDDWTVRGGEGVL